MKSKHLSSAQGFSLVELLVVIAVIAIIAAIAIPNIANITGQATYAKDQRNAQNIASVAAAARAAGIGNDWTSPQTAITDLMAGVSTNINGNSLEFRISPLSTADQTGALRFLTNQGTLTTYRTTTN